MENTNQKMVKTGESVLSTETPRRELTETALCAKEIRKVLKVTFAKTKFKVNSSNYSMGNSVNVSWTNGPTTDQVEGSIKHFQYGHFDGMTDCYEYSNSREDIPQTKFLSCNRELSEDVVRKHGEEMARKYELDMPREDLGMSFDFRGEFVNWYQMAWRDLNQVNLEGGN